MDGTVWQCGSHDTALQSTLPRHGAKAWLTALQTVLLGRSSAHAFESHPGSASCGLHACGFRQASTEAVEHTPLTRTNAVCINAHHSRRHQQGGEV